MPVPASRLAPSLATVLLAISPTAAAQDPALPIPPFAELRFDEDWSILSLHELFGRAARVQ